MQTTTEARIYRTTKWHEMQRDEARLQLRTEIRTMKEEMREAAAKAVQGKTQEIQDAASKAYQGPGKYAVECETRQAAGRQGAARYGAMEEAESEEALKRAMEDKLRRGIKALIGPTAEDEIQEMTEQDIERLEEQGGRRGETFRQTIQRKATEIIEALGQADRWKTEIKATKQ